MMIELRQIRRVGHISASQKRLLVRHERVSREQLAKAKPNLSQDVAFRE
jgi:hypothetical protein